MRGAVQSEIDPCTSEALARAALARVTSSAALQKSERLKALLSYIVEEAIAGRSDRIMGKTIAQDVYGRGPESGEDSDNVVRVDARRLRRKLEEYYRTEGSEDPLRIEVAPGAYVPTFWGAPTQVAIEDAPVAPSGTTTSGARSMRLRLIGGIGAGALVLVLVGVLFLFGHRDEKVSPRTAAVPISSTEAETARVIERQALATRSAASVQATNLCDQARGLLFPIADPVNQGLASAIFSKAIDTDPAVGCGYAGAAHALATMAILSGDAAEATDLRRRASKMARDALDRSPTAGWSHSAAAWVAFASKDPEEATRLSELAVKLAGQDGNVLDFRATIAILVGDFAAALAATDPDTARQTGSFRYARRNLRAVTSFHTGDYASTISSLETAIERGDPVSPLTLVFLAAAHQAAGDEREARRFADELRATWPQARPDIALSRLYLKEELSRQVIDRLTAAGWSSPP